jgi:hypothetical protein
MPEYKILAGSVTFSLDVVRARNRLVGHILGNHEFESITHILWVDDDQWPEDINIVPEMVERCKGVLGAPYTNKRHPLRWVHRVDARGVAGVGFGFTMTTRVMIEALAKDARWYTDLPHPVRCPNLFGQLYETVRHADGSEVETLLSEDFSFCKRAREAGYPIELYEKAGIVNHAGGHVWNAHEMKGGVIG